MQPPDRLVQRVGVGRRGGRRRSGRGDRRGRAAEIESEVLVERLRIEKGGKDNQKTTTTTTPTHWPPAHQRLFYGCYYVHHLGSAMPVATVIMPAF